MFVREMMREIDKYWKYLIMGMSGQDYLRMIVTIEKYLSQWIQGM
jgi:hypothetical protein